MTFDDGTVEGGTSGWDHVKLEEEKLGATLVLCVVEWQKPETGRSREMDLGPTEADTCLPTYLIVNVSVEVCHLDNLSLDPFKFKLLCSSSSAPNTSTPDVSVPWLHISQFCLLSFLEV